MLLSASVSEPRLIPRWSRAIAVLIGVLLAGASLSVAAPANAASDPLTSAQRDAIVAAARSLVGTQYGTDIGWGHDPSQAGPTALNNKSSVVAVGSSDARIDCSGLTRFAYAAIGLDIERISGLPLTGSVDSGSGSQPSRFDAISESEALPGDLVWWSGHVAIFVSDGVVIESPQKNSTVHEGKPIMNPSRTHIYYRLKPEYAALATQPAGSASATANYKFIFSPGDFDRDAERNVDLLLVTNDGKLMMRSGDGAGGFGPLREVGQNTDDWDVQKKVFGPGDIDHDGNNDVLAVNADGQLVAYYGTGNGTFRNPDGNGPIYGSGGWGVYWSVSGVGDLHGDRPQWQDSYGESHEGYVDWITVDNDGLLWRYDGKSAGDYVDRVQIGHGWYIYKNVFGVGDFNGDAIGDVLAIEKNGDLWFYAGKANGEFEVRVRIGWSWQNYAHVFGPGDVDSDGHPDVLAIDASGTMWLYRGNGEGRFIEPIVVGTGSWDLLSVKQTVGNWASNSTDFSAGVPDVVAVDSAGALRLYQGNGQGNFTKPGGAGGDVIGSSGWQAYKTVFGAGNFDGDAQGIDDALAVGYDGVLYLYRGEVSSRYYAPRVKVGAGTGWAAYKEVFGVGRFDSDAYPDVLARKQDGTLLLFKGDGAGGFLSATGTTVSTSWAGNLSVLGAGDVNVDGFPDVMAIGPDGSLQVFYGNGVGGFSNSAGTVLASSGWDQYKFVFAAGDVDRDSLQDLWAVDKSGKLLLFPGKYPFLASARTKVSSDW